MNIKSQIRLMLFLAVATVATAGVQAGALWWQLTDRSSSSTIDGTSYSDYTSWGANGVRLLYAASDGGQMSVATAAEGYTHYTLPQGNGGDTFALDALFVDGGVKSVLGSSSATAYAFMVEIGIWSTGGDFATVAISVLDYKSYDDYIATESITSPQMLSISMADFKAVPEPASGLLAMIGIGLLGLRRKRASRANA